MSEKPKKRHRGRTVCLVIVGVLLAVVLLGVVYVNDYYHSDDSVEEYLQGDETTTVTEIKGGLFLDGPGEEAALIFYPGAKVEYTAYLPLFFNLASSGADVFLLKMPCNLAFLGQNKASDVMEAYDYSRWYLSGHSLGGAMAASYAAKHGEELSGLILLAAYPTEDLSGYDLSVLSLYGSEDQVLNREKVEEGRDLMPQDYTELCIEGGNHAGFGNYGVQKGDGKAQISASSQQEQALQAMLEMIQ